MTRILIFLVNAIVAFEISAASPQHYGRTRDFDLQHVKVNLDIDFRQKAIAGVASLTFKPLRPNRTYVALDAADLNIEAIRLNHTPLTFHQEGTSLTINLPKDFPMPDNFTLDISYSATPFRGLNFFQTPLQVWSQGEAESTRYWVPIYDFPNEMTTSEMIVRVPESFFAVSNGSLLEEKNKGGTKEYHYRQDVPHATYLLSLIAGEFNVVKDTYGKIPLWYVSRLKDTAQVREIFSKTPKMMALMEKWLGEPYPYVKYAQTVVHEFSAGGMENVSATTLHDFVLYPASQKQDWQERTDALIAHELAHQWFGDLITGENWAHLWLNEGFATYFAALIMGEFYGSTNTEVTMWKAAQSIISDNNGRATFSRDFEDPDTIFDSAVYARGAWVLRMIRAQIGDAYFWKGLQTYIQKFKFRNAETDDLRHVFEEVSGMDLSKFFDQWVSRAGWLDLSVDTEWAPERKIYTINLKQLPIKGTTDNYYDVDVEVWFFEKGKHTAKTVTLKGERASLVLALDQAPDYVLVDPMGKWLRKVNYANASFLDQRLAIKDTVFPNFEALEQFKKKYTPTDIAMLKQILTSHSLWEIRDEAARTLGEIGLPQTYDVLLENFKTESDSRVRSTIAVALFKDLRTSTVEYLKKHIKNEGSHIVKAQIAKYFAINHVESFLPSLEALALTPSHRYVMTNQIMDGIGQSAWGSSQKLVEKVLAADNTFTAKSAALRALGAIGFYEKDQRAIIKVIVPYLKHSSIDVQEAALTALARLKSDAARALIANYRAPTWSPQTQKHKESSLVTVTSEKNENNAKKISELETKTQELEKEIELIKQKISK